MHVQEPDEDKDEDDDKWDLAKQVQDTLDHPERASMQVQDLPKEEDTAMAGKLSAQNTGGFRCKRSRGQSLCPLLVTGS